MVGLTVSIVTTTTSEAVHPLAPVAVTVNVPAAFTVMEAVVWLPLLHNRVEPADEVAVSVAEVLIQLMTLSIPALTVGLTVSMVTTTTSEAVHPLLPVAVTVNVPAEVTVIDAVV